MGVSTPAVNGAHVADLSDICPGCGSILANHTCGTVVTTGLLNHTGHVVLNSGSVRRVTQDLCPDCGGPLHNNAPKNLRAFECITRQYIAAGNPALPSPLDGSALILVGQWWTLNPNTGTGLNKGLIAQQARQAVKASQPVQTPADKKGKRANVPDPSVPVMPIPDSVTLPADLAVSEVETADSADIAAMIPATAMETATAANVDTSTDGDANADDEAVRKAMKAGRRKIK